MNSIRHQLHACPEVAFCEYQTSALVTEVLNNYGAEVVAFSGGIVGILRSERGDAPPHRAIRAELDALPIVEETDLSYRSTNGAMHACGHDGHMAIVLGVAEYWSRQHDVFPSTVYLVFTPAEEEVKAREASHVSVVILFATSRKSPTHADETTAPLLVYFFKVNFFPKEKNHPDTTGALIRLIVLDLGHSTIDSLGLLCYGGPTKAWPSFLPHELQWGV